MSTTLIEHANAELTRITGLEADARSELASAQAARGAARDTLSAALEARRTAEEAVAAVREALGQAEVAPAASSGGSDLRDALVELRSKQAEWLEATLELGSAEDWLSMASAELEAQRGALAAATSAQAEQQARATALATKTAALAADPLATLATDAGALKAGSSYTAASAKVDASLPAKLRTLALARHADLDAGDAARRGQREALEDLLDASGAEVGATGKSLATLLRALDRAEAALDAYVGRAALELDEAQTLLATIAARPSIDAEVRTALDSDTDRDAAADAELALIAAGAELRGKSLALELAKAQLLAEDPDADLDSDLEVEPGVTLDDLRAAVSAAEATLSGAESAYTTDMRARMDAWQADVPASVWTDLLELSRVDELLDGLIAVVSPGDLATEVSATEAALVTGLEAELTRTRSDCATTLTLDEADRVADRDDALVNERRRAALEGRR